MVGPSADTLPASAKTWSLMVDGAPYTYGDMHEIMHRDIAIGNDFRKERIKLLITLATGVFALMVTFHKDLFGGKMAPHALQALLLGFILLLGSVLAGIYHFKAWEDFYLAHRGLSTAVWRYHTAAGATDEQVEAAHEFNKARQAVKTAQNSYGTYDFWQTYTLIGGLIMIVIYVALETKSLPTADTKSTTPTHAAGQASTTQGAGE